MSAVTAYSWSDYDESKSVLGYDAGAKYDVNTFAFQALYGYDLYLENGFDVTPMAGFRYLRIAQDAYTNRLGVTVEDRDLDVFTTLAGVKIAREFDVCNCLVIRPELRAAITYDLTGNSNTSVVALPNDRVYRVNGQKLKRLGYEVGARVAANLSDKMEVSAGYQGRLRSDYEDHSGMLDLMYKL